MEHKLYGWMHPTLAGKIPWMLLVGSRGGAFARANAEPWGDVCGGAGFGARFYLKKNNIKSSSDAHHAGISLPPSLPGQHPRFPTVALWVTVALAICVLGLLIVLAYVCQKKIRESCEEEEENAGNVAVTFPTKRGGVCRG